MTVVKSIESFWLTRRQAAERRAPSKDVTIRAAKLSGRGQLGRRRCARSPASASCSSRTIPATRASSARCWPRPGRASSSSGWSASRTASSAARRRAGRRRRDSPRPLAARTATASPPSSACTRRRPACRPSSSPVSRTRSWPPRPCGGGAQDYLPKSQVDGPLLSRAVRYAIERQRADEALRRSEEKLRLAMEASESGVWDFDVRARHGHRERRLPGDARPRGRRGDRAVSMRRGPCTSTPTTARRLCEAARGHASPDARPTSSTTIACSRRTAAWLWVHGKGSVVERGAHGEPLRLLMTRTNITARKAAEAAAAENADRFEEQRRIATALQENFIRPTP